ncbi:MAG: polysaccharide deacetylase family protein [Bacteroidota bacterium]|nr:polysaccharide deacetylase family protein [Bacteroidota bacterium]
MESGFCQKKKIALTFDDSPDSLYTCRVLKILKKQKVHATFFMIGSFAEHNGKIVRKIHRQGHCIGNHSYHHLNFWNVSGNDLVNNEIGRTASIIHQFTGVTPRLYRPPYGDIQDSLRTYLELRGYKVVLWTIDPKDWDLHNTPEEIVRTVVDQAKDSSIVLLHCGNGDRSHTVTALPEIIKGLRNMDFEFVRLDDLLGMTENKEMDIVKARN